MSQDNPSNKPHSSSLRRLRIIKERRRAQFGRAVFVGGLAGLIAVLFQKSLFFAEFFRATAIEWLKANVPEFGWMVFPLIASILGCLTAFITLRYAPEASGSGIPHLKGVLMNVRRFSWPRLLIVKFFGGLMAIGSGFSLGREGPTVQMGAAAGDIVATVVRARPRERKHLLTCGAGAGLAAAFNAPLAGFIFVIEELHRELSPITYGTALIASVVADVVTRTIVGEGPAFHLQGFPLVPLQGLPFVAILGVLAGCLGSLFNRSLISIQKLSCSGRLGSAPAQAAATGIVIGICAWFVPLSIGSGHGTVEIILQGDSPWTNVFLLGFGLFALKWLMTVLSYGTRVPGGIFAPMLVLGAIMGVLFGHAVSLLLPDLGIHPSAIGVIGMAAFFTATVRAPLTGIILILEMTGNYEQLFPLLVACMAAYITSERLHSKPIYDSLLESDLEQAGIYREGQSEMSVFEMTVEPDSALCGRHIRTAGFPAGCLLISIKRGKQELIPHGETVIESGDELTLVISADEPDAYGSVIKMARAEW